MKTSLRTQCHIRLDHLEHNLKWLSQWSTDLVCPMVKANAYGHGAIPVAKELEKLGVSHLGVTYAEEGVELRSAGIKTPILVFGGIEDEFIETIEEFDLTPVVSNWHQLEQLEALSGPRAASCHLKMDTGMHRLGFEPDDAEPLFERLWNNKKIRVRGLLTHFSDGDDILDPSGHTRKQLVHLEECREIFSSFKVPVHALASAPLLQLLHQGELPSDLSFLKGYGIRPGLSLYGVSPVEGLGEELKPVMKITSQLVQIRKIKKGESVSYGSRWTAPHSTTLGVLAMGYEDGLPRRASGQLKFTAGNKTFNQVGTICMDYCMVDLGQHCDQVKMGDRLTLIDENEPTHINQIAQATGTLAYEIMTGIGRRVHRVYIRESE